MKILLLLIGICAAQHPIELPKKWPAPTVTEIRTAEAFQAAFGDTTYLPLDTFHLEKDSVWRLIPHERLVKVSAIPISVGDYLKEPRMITSDSSWAHFCLEQSISLELQPDFSKECVVLGYAWGDCHARYTHNFYMGGDTLYWLTGDEWGGCRAAGRKVFALVVSAAPKHLRPVVYDIPDR